jgi:hypothetical protein
VAAVRADLGLDPTSTVVLYAPTHREYLPSFQPMLDVDELADLLGPTVTLLVRVHYFYPGGPEPSHPNVRDVSEHACVEDLLLAADVLITDFSSVMFDYGVLDRPIVIYAPDWDAYQRTRGVTFDLIAQPPGVVATTQADLQRAFDTGRVIATAEKARRSSARVLRPRRRFFRDGSTPGLRRNGRPARRRGVEHRQAVADDVGSPDDPAHPASAGSPRWRFASSRAWRLGALTYGATQLVLLLWWIAFFGLMSYDSVMYLWQATTDNWSTSHRSPTTHCCGSRCSSPASRVGHSAQTAAMAGGLAYAVVDCSGCGCPADGRSPRSPRPACPWSAFTSYVSRHRVRDLPGVASVPSQGSSRRDSVPATPAPSAVDTLRRVRRDGAVPPTACRYRLTTAGLVAVLSDPVAAGGLRIPPSRSASWRTSPSTRAGGAAPDPNCCSDRRMPTRRRVRAAPSVFADRESRGSRRCPTGATPRTATTRTGRRVRTAAVLHRGRAGRPGHSSICGCGSSRAPDVIAGSAVPGSIA